MRQSYWEILLVKYCSLARYEPDTNSSIRNKPILIKDRNFCVPWVHLGQASELAYACAVIYHRPKSLGDILVQRPLRRGYMSLIPTVDVLVSGAAMKGECILLE